MKPVKHDDIHTMYNLHNKSKFRGFKTHVNFDCSAFKNQTATFEKRFYLGFGLLEIFKLHTYKI